MRENNLSRQEKEEPPEPGLGPMGFGILVGTIALYVLYLLGPGAFGRLQAGADSGPSSVRFLTGPSAFIPIAVYLAIAVVLAVTPRTSRWGAGLLIGLGMSRPQWFLLMILPLLSWRMLRDSGNHSAQSWEEEWHERRQP